MAIPETLQRRLIEGSTLTVGVVLVAALTVMVNYLALRHHVRFDWTGDKIYTLSDKSRQVIENLDREVELILFMNPGSELYRPVDELLSRYAASNPEFVVKREIDAVRNRLQAQELIDRHQIDRENAIVVASGDDRRVIDEYALAEFDYSGAQFGQAPRMTSFKGEQLVTSAILALIEDRKPRILFTEGHGEVPLEAAGSPRALSQARLYLGKDNFDVEAWNSRTAEGVPPETDLVVVAGPQTAFSEAELQAFGQYFDDGGRLLWLLDPALQEGDDEVSLQVNDLGLADWLAARGVLVRDDLIFDPAESVSGYGPELFYSADYGVHPIVDDLRQARVPVLQSMVRSVRQSSTAPDHLRVGEMIRTTAESWAETDFADLAAAGYDEAEDLAGPLSFAVAVEQVGGEEAAASGKAAGGRMVVVGDSDFATDALLASGRTANPTFLLNTFNWLVEREELIAIEPREIEQARFNLSRNELLNLYLLVLLILPGAAVAAGIWIHLRRRR